MKNNSQKPNEAGKDNQKFKGRRVTRQRKLLLQLIEDTDGHLDANELYQLAREKNKRINLSTVYRTLALLKKNEIVEELHLNEEHHHYETKPATEHFHLVCANCQQVIEFTSPLVEALKRAVAKEHKFKLKRAQIELTGYCRRCQEKVK